MKAFPYSSLRERFDPRFYFVVGPDDCGNRPILDVVAKALDGGVSFVQLRAKTQDVSQIVSLASDIANEIAGHHVSDSVAFVIDDRVDAALQARQQGIKVDGVHIGQDVLDPVVARKLLGPDAIIGLSANPVDEVREANALPAGTIDYIGAGPLHMTATKPDSAVLDGNGEATTLDAESIDAMCTISKYPLIVGGGVKIDDIPMLAKTQADGWFVVSAIAAAADPEQAARELVDNWTAIRGDETVRYADRKHSATKLPAVLTIATTDSSGGAGVPADLKTMLANDVFGECVIAGITAQNTKGVQEIAAVDPKMVGAQIDSVFDDIRPSAVKIGVIVGVESVKMVARKLKDHESSNIVVDPVMVATSGSSLAADDTIAEEIKELFPIATVITPNIPEAQVLAQMPIGNHADMETAAVQLAKDYGIAVLVKGGHGVDDANDVLALPDGRTTWFEGEHIDNTNTHGTGCTLSSAIASYLALGESLEDAITDAKAYLSGALRANLNLGAGHGPMDHAWTMH